MKSKLSTAKQYMTVVFWRIFCGKKYSRILSFIHQIDIDTICMTSYYWSVECEYGIYPAGIFIDSCAANSLFTRHEIGRHAKKEVWIRISVFRFFILLFFIPFQSSRSLSSASIYPNLSILFRPQESFECVCVHVLNKKVYPLPPSTWCMPIFTIHHCFSL